jgi:hypothetical protein
MYVYVCIHTQTHTHTHICVIFGISSSYFMAPSHASGTTPSVIAHPAATMTTQQPFEPFPLSPARTRAARAPCALWQGWCFPCSAGSCRRLSAAGRPPPAPPPGAAPWLALRRTAEPPQNPPVAETGAGAPARQRGRALTHAAAPAPDSTCSPHRCAALPCAPASRLLRRLFRALRWPWKHRAYVSVLVRSVRVLYICTMTCLQPCCVRTCTRRVSEDIWLLRTRPLGVAIPVQLVRTILQLLAAAAAILQLHCCSRRVTEDSGFFWVRRRRGEEWGRRCTAPSADRWKSGSWQHWRLRKTPTESSSSRLS